MFPHSVVFNPPSHMATPGKNQLIEEDFTKKWKKLLDEIDLCAASAPVEQKPNAELEYWLNSWMLFYANLEELLKESCRVQIKMPEFSPGDNWNICRCKALQCQFEGMISHHQQEDQSASSDNSQPGLSKTSSHMQKSKERVAPLQKEGVTCTEASVGSAKNHGGETGIQEVEMANDPCIQPQTAGRKVKNKQQVMKLSSNKHLWSPPPPDATPPNPASKWLKSTTSPSILLTVVVQTSSPQPPPLSALPAAEEHSSMKIVRGPPSCLDKPPLACTSFHPVPLSSTSQVALSTTATSHLAHLAQNYSGNSERFKWNRMDIDVHTGLKAVLEDPAVLQAVTDKLPSAGDAYSLSLLSPCCRLPHPSNQIFSKAPPVPLHTSILTVQA
ncbi:hypothetical protein F5J12DRAFT_956988 [Pisolithus orientalis]|uniref:uncharacterized protein n=1 Tax=Pisolithus orientalis TaxID=936130 RepID=UPI00222503E0|nr:uncharacterized protein F5J12DRAFT_956988 [Pisolithus orientalis]KAI5997242.1 hypothetical protein F5J12DRAFT_956988 [Pisolithus orientalis]